MNRILDEQLIEELINYSDYDAVYSMLLPNGEYEFITDSIYPISGFTPDEFYNTPLLIKNIIDESFQEYFQNEWNALLRGNGKETYEYIIKTKSGEQKLIHQRNLIQKDDSGKAVRIKGILTDITENIDIKNEFFSNEKFKTIFELSPDPVLIMQGEKILDCNQAAVEIIGAHSKTQLIEIHPTLISPQKQPDGQISVTKAHKIFEKIYAQGVARFEWMFNKIDGSDLYVEVTVTKFEVNKNNLLHVHWKDISEKKEIETQLDYNRKRFTEISEISSDWVWEVNKNGIYTYVGSRVKDFLGYEDKDIIGTSPFALMSKEEATRMGEIFLEHISKQLPFKNLENINIHKDGHEVVLQTSGVPIFDIHGEFVGYRGTDRDITEIKQIINQLKKATIEHDAILDTTNDGFWMSDTKGNLLEVNNAYSKMSGYTKNELLNLSIKDIEAIESPEETKKHIDHIIKYGNETFETIHIKKNGQHYPVEVSTSFSSIEGGRFFVLVRDITERKNSENELLLASKVFSTMTDGVLITDENQRIINVNDSFCKVTGFHREELLGRNPSLLSSGWHEKDFYKEMWLSIHEEGSWQGEIADRKKNGETYIAQTSIVAIKNQHNITTNYIAVSSDVTHKKEQEEIINNLAYYDALTKLPNKVLFEERFNNHLNIAKRHNNKMALFFIDLDNFKNINDTLGHLIGDQFLKDAAVRMKSVLRAEDTIGRFGGDEFAILIHDITSISGVGSLAEKIVNIFKKPFVLNDSEVFSGASIGISIYPDDALDYVEMTRLADTAMYHVKHGGKNGYEFFSQSMNESIAKKMQIENALYNALDNNEFYLTYQPKVNIETNKIYGLEALIRWNHPTLGFIGPDQFIPIAEDNGQIYNIGLWVLKEATKDLKKLHNLGFSDLIMSINVSNKQIEKSHFLDDFKEIVNTIELEKKFIDLEITESQIMGNIESSLMILNDIHKRGIKLSIDDFGTGYSSLSYLKKIPFQTIKIDKSFVLDIDKDEDDKIIVSSIIALAKALNKDVIAEGSETKEHINILKSLGVTQIQGYFYSKPLKFEELKEFIEEF